MDELYFVLSPDQHRELLEHLRVAQRRYEDEAIALTMLSADPSDRAGQLARARMSAAENTETLLRLLARF